MGKIRLTTLGDKEEEQKQAQDAAKRKAIKKSKKGEEITAEEQEALEAQKKTSETEEVTSESETSTTDAPITEEKSEKAPKAKKAAPKAASGSDDATAKRLPPQLRRKKVVGKNAKAARKKVDSAQKFEIAEAIKTLKSLSYAKFDETVELHLNVREKGLKGEVDLPHGTGKKMNIAIADEKLLNEIEAGNINFDILIAAPSFMPKLVPFARVLGPKGLMPNPKNGTVSDDPKAAAEKFQGGSVHYKTDPKAPIIHQAIGKMSLKDADIKENAETLINAVQKKNIISAYLSASMTPSVQIDLS